jgi:large subunit ribosomal protein L31e
MAEETKKEETVVLEREYVVPLRRKCINTPQYKRTPKAIKTLKEFIAKHMKVFERDTDNVRLDKNLNLEIWQRGIRKPMTKVKVKAKKYDSGIVRVELSEIPQYLKWKIDKEKKMFEEGKEMKNEKTGEKKEEKPKTEDEKKDEKEKQKSEVDAGMRASEQQSKEMKHMKTKEKPQIHRMALQK